jgi:FkbM family methyltransferase
MLVDDLNAAVREVPKLPRVRFEASIASGAHIWLSTRHKGGAVHEPGTIAAFAAAQKLNYCWNIFDIGAHYGYFTILCQQLFKNAYLTAFEMHPGVIRSLRTNVGPGVKVVHGVVSDAPQKAVEFLVSGWNIFERPENGWGVNLCNVPQEARKKRGPNMTGVAQLDFITLDEYCKANRAPELLKIDVEGFQARAILGAMEMVRQHKPIIITELHDPEKLLRYKTTNKETVRPLFEAGYRGAWCGNHRSNDAVFEPINEIDDMNAGHERLSIMVLTAR